jgi:hypothetical protein
MIHIRKIYFQTIVEFMGWKYCLFHDHFKIERHWSGKIINIGWGALYLVIDMRKDWLKDMITGNPE